MSSWKRRRQHEVDQRPRAGRILRVGEHPGELDLAEARSGHDADGRRRLLAVREHHVGRGIGRVRHDERPVTAPAARGEVGGVRLLPPVDDAHAVRRAAPSSSRCQPSSPNCGDRREQEREAGRRRRRVLDHEQLAVRGLRRDRRATSAPADDRRARTRRGRRSTHTSALSIGVTRFFGSSRKRSGTLVDSLRGVRLEQIVVERPA